MTYCHIKPKGVVQEKFECVQTCCFTTEVDEKHITPSFPRNKFSVPAKTEIHDMNADRYLKHHCYVFFTKWLFLSLGLESKFSSLIVKRLHHSISLQSSNKVALLFWITMQQTNNVYNDHLSKLKSDQISLLSSLWRESRVSPVSQPGDLVKSLSRDKHTHTHTHTRTRARTQH